MPTCPECSAPFPEGGSCQDNFHALLALEWQVEGGSSRLGHYYAVSTYALQHPVSMNFTEETLSGMRENLAEVLEGSAMLSEILRRTRASTNGATRVRRRPHDKTPCTPQIQWTHNVTLLLTEEPTALTFEQKCAVWAEAVLKDLNSAEHLVK